MDTATDCPVCLGVSAGGRIRLTDEGADLLLVLLHDARVKAFEDRRLVIDAGNSPQIYNQRLSLIRQMTSEVRRTQDEMGWSGGQPQRTHT